jgi:3-oxoacyl-[acyl-carrier-protein] synthase II
VAAVVGAGLKAPGGLHPDALFQSLCAAAHTAAPFEDPRLNADTAMLASRADGFTTSDYLSATEVRRLDRCQQLALAAAQDALDSATVQMPEPERCAIVCGIGLGATATYEQQLTNLIQRGPRGLNPLTVPTLMASSTAAQLSLRFGFRGPTLTVSAACASGAQAIGEGVELLRRDAADLVLAGGAEALVNYSAMCAFLRIDAMTRNIVEPALASRPFDVDRDGFVMGEGAGFVVLARDTDADAQLGFVLGYGTSCDAHHLVAPAPDGEGAARCMRHAIADAGITAHDINHVNAHGTSTPLNDLAEARALKTVFDGTEVPVTSNKGTTGHLVAGSGAVEAIMTLWSLRHAVVPPVAGLRHTDPAIEPLDVVKAVPRAIGDGFGITNSFGFGGVNTSLVMGTVKPTVG